MLYTTADQTLRLHDARRDTTHQLASNVKADGPDAVSPSGQYLAFSYSTADSTHLELLDLRSQALQQVHTVERPATFSVAWHPTQDRLAFGVYRSTEVEGRGPGGIRVATPGSSSRNVGCQTVREVLHWLPDGTLATRTAENLYLVSVADCTTRASLDARRMHHIAYAPDDRRMAYIHRELTYDRAAGDYLPDSSLVLSDVRGENAQTLFGDERHVRHLRWAPNGSELAFDVQPEEGNHRQIVIYNGDRTVYLVPPNQTSADQVHPRWSPSGSRLAFTLRTSGPSRAAVRVKGQTRQLGPVRGAVWGWLDDRIVVVPGPDSLRVQTLSGTTRYRHPTPETLIHVWRRAVS